MSNPKTSLPIEPGDLIIESVGNELRFWEMREVTELGHLGERRVRKYRKLGRSWVFMRQRFLDLTDHKPLPAATLTAARTYGDDGRKIVAEFFPTAKRAHLFYAGRGPSGDLWGFPGYDGGPVHFSYLYES